MTLLAFTVVALVGSTTKTATAAFLPSHSSANPVSISFRSKPQAFNLNARQDQSYHALKAKKRTSTVASFEQVLVPATESALSSTPARPSTSLPPRRRSAGSKRKSDRSNPFRQSSIPLQNHPRHALTPQDLLSDLPYLDKHQFVDKLIEQTPVSLTAQCSTSFMPALVLNADYQPLSFTPLSLWSWQEAVKAVFRGKVTVVDVYENAVIRGVSLEIPLPSVIALNEYVSNHKSIPAFTKRNVYLRDEYRCQYCNGEFFSQNDLSIDHVHPRCKGGRLNWENAVTCCRICNGRKGSLGVGELESVGMRLLRPPKVPSQYELSRIASRLWLPRRKVHPTWKPYLDQFVEP